MSSIKILLNQVSLILNFSVLRCVLDFWSQSWILYLSSVQPGCILALQLAKSLWTVTLSSALDWIWDSNYLQMEEDIKGNVVRILVKHQGWLESSEPNNVCRICTGSYHSFGHPQRHLPLLSSPGLVLYQGWCENICKMFFESNTYYCYQLGFLCPKWQKTLSQIALRSKFTATTYEEL